MPSATEKLGDLAKSALVIFIGTTLARVLGLVGEVVIIRSLDPGSYGHLALAYTIVVLGSQVVLAGLPDGITRLLSAEEDVDRKREILNSGFALSVLFGAVAVGVIALTRFRLSDLMDDPTLAGLLPLFLPYVLIYPTAMVAFNVLRSRGRSRGALVTRYLGPRTLSLLLLFATIYVVGSPPTGAITYWVSFPIFILLGTAYIIHEELNLVKIARNSPTLDSLSKLLVFSWPLAFGSVILILLANLDILMIGYFLDSREVGLYRSIQPFRQVTAFTTVAFSFLFLPLATRFFSSGRTAQLRDLYKTSTKWISLVTLPFVLVFAIFSEDVILILFDAAYLPAATAMTILIAGLFVRPLVGLNGEMVKAIDRTKIELVSSLVGVAVNVVLNVQLIPVFGITGAAIATVVGYAVYNITELGAIYRVVGIHPFSSNLFKPLVVTAAFAVGTGMLLRGVRLNLSELVAIGMMFSVVQLAAVVVTGSIGEADLFLLDQFERKTGFSMDGVKRVARRFGK